MKVESLGRGAASEFVKRAIKARRSLLKKDSGESKEEHNALQRASPALKNGYFNKQT